RVDGEADYELLRAVAEGRGVSGLEQHVAELSRRGFLVSRHSLGGERYVFRHALIRDAAYRTMLRTTRRSCHAQVAEVLERDFPEIVEREPETLALHQAGAARCAEAAMSWLKAGRQAVACAAYPEAIGQLRKGLQALESLPASRDRSHREVQLLESLGMAYYSTMGYAVPQVEETFGRAASICHELGEEVPLQILYGIWSVRFVRGDVVETAEIVSRMLERADRAEEPLSALYAHGCYGLRAGPPR